MAKITITQAIYKCETNEGCDMFPCPGHDWCPFFTEQVVEGYIVREIEENVQ